MVTKPAKSKAEREAEEMLAVRISDFIEMAIRVVRAGKLLVRTSDSSSKKTKAGSNRRADR